MEAKFSAPVHTGPGAHSASCIISFPGVQCPAYGNDHSVSSSAQVKERAELYLYILSGPSWPVLGCRIIIFTLTSIPHVIHSYYLFSMCFCLWFVMGHICLTFPVLSL